jgi:hypothetical protein
LLAQAIFEAEPRHWLSSSSLPGLLPSQLHPFAKAHFQDVCLDLAALKGSKSAYIGITATSVKCDDLRLAYCNAMEELEIVRDGSAVAAAMQSGVFSAFGQGDILHLNLDT